MLTIQRASAGSGKTYTLARIFILNLIAYKTNSGTWKLRNERQMEDALTHILAITFTNKATNEMKQRIVSNLSLLSKAASPHVDENLLEDIPYLNDFKDLIGSSSKEIGEASELALRVILNHYSDFKISTIDSFFQEILRIFTYEANINESYQLEIDSSFVNDAALDAAINELDTHPERMGNASFWLTTLMKEESKKSQKWNLFNKKSSSGSIYAKIKWALTQLEKEDFKDVKQSLENYFENQRNASVLPELYKELRERANLERDSKLKALKKKAADAEDFLLKNNLSKTQVSSYFVNHIAIVQNLRPDEKFKNSYSSIVNEGTVFKKKFRIDNHPLDDIALELYRLIEDWNNPSFDSYYKNWTIYGSLIPYFGLMFEVKSFLSEVLNTNNLLQLSETGYILKKIIGNEDAPFVYERLGNKIENYLIDEFQDTSRMQWDVIYPLINEGLSKDKESLIIGDPKQSIYRFRNADHQLITHVVPSLFPGHHAAGYSVEENTNWRSHTNVVKFNNYFFRTLSEYITGISAQKGGKTNFNDLYSNVLQTPHDNKGMGYVEVRFFSQNKESFENLSEEEVEEGRSDLNRYDENVIQNLINVITSLKERGYRQKDIGILVNRNDQSKLIIDALIDYNETLKDHSQKIDFVCEESLLVSSSRAVNLILSVLEKLTQPGNFISPKEKDSEDQKPLYLSWNNIKISFSLYSHKHSDLDPAECLMKFLNETDFDISLASLLEDLPSPTLACLIESIIKTLLDEKFKSTDAIYLSSFQDIVNEYSSGHPNDPASFLEWWKAHGYNISISSTQDIDAIQIMTIHKSKGLEFKCVIVPFATDSFLPSKFEWRWVKPYQFEEMNLPPVLPIKTSAELEGSIHQKVYWEYIDQVLTDRLNMYYVAFTRARNELYVFTKDEPGKNPSKMQNFLHHILNGKIKPSQISADEEKILLTADEFIISDDNSKITFGKPFSSQEIVIENRKDDEKKSKQVKAETKVFHDYYINNKRPRLRSLATKILPSGENI